MYYPSLSVLIKRALILYQNANLEVDIVSYGSSKSSVQQMIREVPDCFGR